MCVRDCCSDHSREIVVRWETKEGSLQGGRDDDTDF